MAVSRESVTFDSKLTCKGKFEETDLSEILFIEVFAGTAQLTKAVRGLGMRVLAVDHSSKRAHGVHIALFDLTCPEQVAQLSALVHEERARLAWIHFAPACGTASRARERPLPHLEAQGYPVAQPLRSPEFPLGLPNLQGVDKERVAKANKTYEATANLCQQAIALNITCSLENPVNSLFWCVPCIAQLVQTGHTCVFDNCMHGGARKKTTRWWSSEPWFDSLQGLCDGKHQHKPWAPVQEAGRLRYPSAEEAAYPPLLCERLASILVEQCKALGAVLSSDLSSQKLHTSINTHRFLLNMLPRGKQFKPLVSEFASYVALLHPSDVPLTTAISMFPKGARSTSRQVWEWGKIRADCRFDSFSFSAELRERLHSLEVSSKVELHQVGIPREPEDFVSRATECGHPRSSAVHLSKEVVRVLEENLCDNKCDSDLAAVRVGFIKKWTKRAVELKQQEASLKDSMPEYLSTLLRPKKLLLLKEMLEELEYPDAKLVDDICKGFRLSGWLETTGVFPPCVKRPQYDLGTLLLLAKGLNKSIISRVESGDASSDIAKTTWHQTLEEVEKGYVWFAEVPDPQSFVLAKRFGLQQAEKVRVIDDCTIGGLNKAIGLVEKYKIHSIEEIAAFLCWMLSFMGKTGKHFPLIGRTFDLKAAYKQFGIHPDDRNLLRIVCQKPDSGEVAFLGVNALPFGAVGSVGAFLRISLALWFIGMRGLRLAWSAFFDDFTVISKRSLAVNAEQSVEALFDLLGMNFAREGSISEGFSSVFKTLGLQIDLSSAKSGRVQLGHTEKRRKELQETLSSFIDSGIITPKQAESLRGRMHWYESFVFGRVANQAVQTVGSISTLEVGSHKLSIREIDALKLLRDRVLVSPPLTIAPSSLDAWVIFTDGACEGAEKKVGSIGGVNFDPAGRCRGFFGASVPETYMQRLLKNSLNPIYELEILPVLMSLFIWKSVIARSQVVFYLDNDAARSGLIKGAGATLEASELIREFTCHEMQLQCMTWFARVPTHSNVADGPSRLDFRARILKGAVKEEIPWEDFFSGSRKLD